MSLIKIKGQYYDLKPVGSVPKLTNPKSASKPAKPSLTPAEREELAVKAYIRRQRERMRKHNASPTRLIILGDACDKATR
jgi:hypothetical protein